MKWMSIYQKGAVVLTAPLLILSACASNPAALSSASKATTNLDKTAMTKLHIASLMDDREEGAVLTDLLGRKMEGTNLMDWLESSLDQRGVFYGGTAPEGNSCSVDMAIKRALISAPKGSSKQANLVFSVVPAGEIGAQRKIIRGTAVGVNWASTSGETNRILGNALDDALNNLAEHCDS